MSTSFPLPYCVYVLLSLKDDDVYVGVTGDLERRLGEHFQGRNTSTAPRRPFVLVRAEYYLAKSDAERRELHLKTAKGRRTIRLMLQDSLVQAHQSQGGSWPCAADNGTKGRQMPAARHDPCPGPYGVRVAEANGRTLMRSRHIISAAATALLVLALTTGCRGIATDLGLAPNLDTHTMLFQIRVPAGAPLAPMTQIGVVSDGGTFGTRIYLCNSITNNGSIIYQTGTGINRSKKRCLILQADGESAQVFHIKHPRKPRLAPWTAWQAPDYVDRAQSAWWNALNDQGRETRSTNVPPNCAQFRFKVVTWWTSGPVEYP